MKFRYLSLTSLFLAMLVFTAMKVSANPEDIHDVATVNIELSETDVYPGDVVNITVVVKNLGNVTESFNVSAYYNETEIDPLTEIGTLSVTDLGAGENSTLIFSWNTSGLEPCHWYTVSANATDVPDDINLDNNFLEDGTVKILWETSPIIDKGDLNGDCKVNIRDIARAAQAFGSYVGHDRWDEKADMNKDGVINIRDIAIIAKNFGETSPP